MVEKKEVYSWNVILSEGPNTLHAIGSSRIGRVEDKVQVRYVVR
jgi:hypothetical protein